VTLGPVRVMGAGVVVMMCVEEVNIISMSLYHSSSTVSCPKLPMITNGGFLCISSGMTSTYSFNSTCNLSCDPGYEQIGNEIWICQSDGNWNSSVAMCQRGLCVCVCVCV